MNGLTYVGKLLFALPLAFAGFFHFIAASDMVGTVPSYFPFPIFWVYLTGLGLVLGPVAIILDKKAKLATTLLGLMLLTFAITVHLPGFMNQTFPDAGFFIRDVAIAGGALFMSAHLKN